MRKSVAILVVSAFYFGCLNAWGETIGQRNIRLEKEEAALGVRGERVALMDFLGYWGLNPVINLYFDDREKLVKQQLVNVGRGVVLILSNSSSKLADLYSLQQGLKTISIRCVGIGSHCKYSKEKRELSLDIRSGTYDDVSINSELARVKSTECPAGEMVKLEKQNRNLDYPDHC